MLSSLHLKNATEQDHVSVIFVNHLNARVQLAKMPQLDSFNCVWNTMVIKTYMIWE